MGQQSSSQLNCKVNQNVQKHQITPNKQFFVKKNKPALFKQQSDTLSNNFPTQNLIGQKSPRNQQTSATSERNISSKSSRKTPVIKKFIPQHQAITKVSDIAFPSCIKGNNNYFVQQKTKSLAQIVQTRYNSTKHFPYSQILSLTQNLVYSVAYMTKKKCNHHDYYPTNIYYNQGKFKVINPLQIKCSGFYLTSQRQRFSFLSPQLIIAILQQVSQQDLGQQIMSKSDIFAIGMILLQVCCLQPSSECYDQQSYNIVDSVIKQRLAKVVKIYTPMMAECINLMLQYQVQRRIDPVTMAQLIHWKIQNQKLIALQMEAPKPQTSAPQQGVPGQPVKKVMMPPNMPPGTIPNMPPNIPPQQIRGPPPPYMHQPFKMQNLNPNIIAVPIPNEQFTRIGPNNQGFLSSSSLQQKLRVIQLIKQHPKEDDQQIEQHESKVQQHNEIKQNKQPKDPIPQKQIHNMINQKQESKPQYPLVQSIYNEQPQIQPQITQNSNIQFKPQIVRQIISTQNKQRINPQLVNANPNFNLNQQTNLPQNRIQNNINQRRIENVYVQQPKMNIQQNIQQKKLFQPPIENIKPQSPKYVYRPKTQLLQNKPINMASTEQPRVAYSSPYLSQKPYKRIQQKQMHVTSQSYNSFSANNYKSISNNNIYTVNQQIKQLKTDNNTQINPVSPSSTYLHKYGTSFQLNSQNTGQTLQQRVQRVLNMSKNAK